MVVKVIKDVKVSGSRGKEPSSFGVTDITQDAGGKMVSQVPRFSMLRQLIHVSADGQEAAGKGLSSAGERDHYVRVAERTKLPR